MKPRKLIPYAVLALVVAGLYLTNPDQEKFTKWADGNVSSLASLGNAVTARFAKRMDLFVCSVYSISGPDGKLSAAWLGAAGQFAKIK